MEKISTLYKKDPNNLSRVINEVDPQNKWVFNGYGLPTRKYDGTACALINGELYKRYDVKTGMTIPDGAIACQAKADEHTGHFPCWIKCVRSNPDDKYHFQAFDILEDKIDGTYELCGERINKNRENIVGHELVFHRIVLEEFAIANDYSFESLKTYLEKNDIEGIVFHHISNGRMCKIRKKDFGIKR